MKHLHYLRYLIRHKWFVFLAGIRVGAPIWRLIIHDWSKFLPCEWLPYARYFYGDKPTGRCSRCGSGRIEKAGGEFGVCMYLGCDDPSIDHRLEQQRQNEFDRAWLHHLHLNPHHWQHWILREDSGQTKLLVMPRGFMLEMVADWMGAGRAITGKWDTRTWYANNRENIFLHHSTRARVETLLGFHEGAAR